MSCDGLSPKPQPKIYLLYMLFERTIAGEFGVLIQSTVEFEVATSVPKYTLTRETHKFEGWTLVDYEINNKTS